MGDQFNEYVLQNIKKEDVDSKPIQETKEELTRIVRFLEESNTEKQADKKTVLMNQVNTEIGFLNQLSLRTAHPYLTPILQEIHAHQQTYIQQMNQAREITDEQTLIQTLEALNATVSDYYKQVKEKMMTTVKDSLSAIEERESLLKEIEDLTSRVDQYAANATTEDQKAMVKTLADLYMQAMQEDIHTLEGIQHEVALLKEWKMNASPILEEKATPQIPAASQADSTSFPLFEKMTDQIVSYQMIQENGKTYVKYVLENGKYYFAIVESQEQVEQIYKNFEQNAQLSQEQTKEAWQKNLETIVFCLQVYYVLNEFVRYQEVSNRGQITKEKGEEINKYKNMLAFMEENVLTPYLAYADHLAKQVLVNENSATTFYSNQEPSQEVTKGKVQELIVSILGNQEAQKEFTTRDILETLYPIKEEDYLAKIEKEATPMGHEMQEIAMTETPQEQGKEEVPVPVEPILSTQEQPTVSTNYDAMENYLNTRKQAISSSLPPTETATLSKKEESPMYKDMNGYLDMEEATQVTNLVYQTQNPGQGTNAKIAFLKEGNTGGFTSKYHARELASSVNRNDYFYQMLVQSIKDYATFNEQRKRNQQFGAGIENLFSIVGQEVLEEQFDVTRLVNNIMEDDTMLVALAKNFDGRYLVPNKGDEPLFETVLKDYEQGNPMFATKVQQALTTLRDQFKHAGYQVPTKSSIVQIQIPSGKVAA